uniref:Uncharacterized protein n=1 Tax=Anguilla anguilla TaxID=7936 RepID=A0A0E9UFI3_ANGAN
MRLVIKGHTITIPLKNTVGALHITSHNIQCKINIDRVL